VNNYVVYAGIEMRYRALKQLIENSTMREQDALPSRPSKAVLYSPAGYKLYYIFTNLLGR